MACFVLIPGAWAGAWIWGAVSRDLRGRGHRVYAITLSGLAGARCVDHVGLETHVGNVLDLLEEEDLDGVVLVGHEYAGLVAGQVADRAPDRVAHTVFVEAFLPQHGRSLLDRLRDSGEAANGRVPPPRAEDLAREPDLPPAAARWMLDRFVGHPARTVREPATLRRPLAERRSTYIACTMAGQWVADDVAGMREERGWTFRALAAGRWPMVSAPGHLAELLDAVAVEVDERSS
jgi:pimeloyl-ACP methyl ester carboxylesterase